MTAAADDTLDAKHQESQIGLPHVRRSREEIPGLDAYFFSRSSKVWIRASKNALPSPKPGSSELRVSK